MVASLKIFEPPKTQTEAGQILADHMPQGRAFGKKCEDGSVMSGLIKGLASDFMIVQEQIFELASQFDIKFSIDLLPDWEESVGIPDDCIFQFTTLEQRRDRVIQRLRKVPIVTLDELQNFVNSFFPDDNIILKTGTEIFTFEYQFEFQFLGDVNEKFIIVAEIPVSGSGFEYTFEYQFGGGPNTNLLRCLLRNVLPANVILLIQFIG